MDKHHDDAIATATATALAQLKAAADAAAAVATKECACLPEVLATKTAQEYDAAVNHAADAAVAELDKAHRAFVTAIRGAVAKHGDGVAAKRAGESSGTKDVPPLAHPTQPRQAEQPRGPHPRR